jgi:hypothetical protein
MTLLGPPETLIHGLYFVKEGTLIIKDFEKLQSAVWNNTMFAKNISIYLLYKPGFELKFNYANQQISYSDSPINLLIKYCIKIDGKELTFNALYESAISKIRKKQIEFVNSLSPLEVIKKGAEIYCYMYQEFFDYYNISWKPSGDIIERINKDGLKYYQIFKEEEMIKPEYYRKQFDPRNTFIG